MFLTPPGKISLSVSVRQGSAIWRRRSSAQQKWKSCSERPKTEVGRQKFSDRMTARLHDKRSECESES